MEVIAGWTHTVFPMDDASRVGEARRFAARAVGAMDWNDEDAGRLALVVTELGTNLLRHAGNGRLLIAARAATLDVEVVAVDDGPGIENLPRSMQDGYSSGSTPGTGLGAISRLADEFDIRTSVPQGTVCVARVRRGRACVPPDRQPAFQLGVICVAAPGEAAWGDAWAACLTEARAVLMVADGLGHGPEAARASGAAVAAFAGHAGADLRDIVQRTHVHLQTTRGAALCVAALDAGATSLSYAGAGNISGRVLSGVFDKSFVTQHGTVGAQIRRPELASTAMPEHALLILHSDGIESRWKPDLVRPMLRCDPTLVAASLWRDHTRHRDDATVLVLRRRG